MKLEFVDEDEDPRIIIDGEQIIRRRDPLDGTRLKGLTGRMSPPLFEILKALARRRCFGSGDGMVSAQELALDLRTITPARLRNVLSDHIVDGVSDPIVKVQAAQADPRRGRGRGRDRGGRSRGPYQLALDPESVSFSPPVSKHEVSPLVMQTEALDAEWALTESRSLIASGEFSAARTILLRACGQDAQYKTRAQRAVVSSLWRELAHVEMELGMSRLALRAARRSAELARRLGDTRMLSHAKLVEAHARGQLQRGTSPLAHAAVEEAIKISNISLKRGHLRRLRDPRKIELLGVYGQYLSRVQRDREARTFLEAALDASLASGATRWVYTWQGRLAENALNAGRPAEAEPWIDSLLGVAAGRMVSTNAFLTRLTARFMAATSQWDLAVTSLLEAHAIGVERRMRYQLALVEAQWTTTPELLERLPLGPGETPEVLD